MIGIIIVKKDGTKDICILSNDTDVKELLSEIKDVESYTIVPRCRTSYKVYEEVQVLRRTMETFEDLCRGRNDDEFKKKLTDGDKKTIQEMFDAFSKVYKDLLQ